jgi:hypothetical protein
MLAHARRHVQRSPIRMSDLTRTKKSAESGKVAYIHNPNILEDNPHPDHRKTYDAGGHHVNVFSRWFNL